MSGGHWDYNQYRVREILEGIGLDGQVIMRFPGLAHVFRILARDLEKIIHDLDWDLSCDTEIADDAAFEKAAIEKIMTALGQEYRVKVYEIKEAS